MATSRALDIFVQKLGAAARICQRQVERYEGKGALRDVFRRSDEFICLLKKIGKEKGSGKNATAKAGSISKAQLREIAEKKLSDLNANSVEAAMKVLAGSARSMGVDVK